MAEVTRIDLATQVQNQTLERQDSKLVVYELRNINNSTEQNFPDNPWRLGQIFLLDHHLTFLCGWDEHGELCLRVLDACSLYAEDVVNGKIHFDVCCSIWSAEFNTFQCGSSFNRSVDFEDIDFDSSVVDESLDVLHKFEIPHIKITINVKVSCKASQESILRMGTRCTPLPSPNVSDGVMSDLMRSRNDIPPDVTYALNLKKFMPI